MAQLTWLVTGCSSGFGAEFVHQILSRNDRVIATARDSTKLEALAKKGAATLQLDVTHAQGSIDQIMAYAISIYGRIDVLVNNAGFVTGGSIEDLRYEDLLASFETNAFGPIKVTRALLPHFRQRKSGTMVFISSLSGWVGHHFTGAYAGSKFALEGLVESLHKETAPLGLRTILMEPGRFRTPLLSQSNLKFRNSKFSDYDAASEAHAVGLRDGSMKQPGDPAKFVGIVLDLVRKEGCGQGREIPFRIPVGADAVEEIERKIRDVANVMEEWRPIITNTDH